MITIDILTFCIVSWIWLDPRRWSQLRNSNTCCLSYTPNTMSADALATSGASASAGMVLTPKAGIFHLHHQKSWNQNAPMAFVNEFSQKMISTGIQHYHYQTLFIHLQLDHFDDKFNSWMTPLTKGSFAITVRDDVLSSRAECHARGDLCLENVTTKPIYMRDTWEQGSTFGTRYTLFTAWNDCGELFTRRCAY